MSQEYYSWRVEISFLVGDPMRIHSRTLVKQIDCLETSIHSVVAPRGF